MPLFKGILFFSEKLFCFYDTIDRDINVFGGLMRILVIDGQGGNLGRELIRSISARFPEASIHAVGTNSAATTNMLKNPGITAATGENAVIVGCRTADIIVGPVGIVLADALMGEVTPSMACAVGQSRAIRVLIPLNRCETLVAGVRDMSTSALIEDAISKISEAAGSLDSGADRKI